MACGVLIIAGIGAFMGLSGLVMCLGLTVVSPSPEVFKTILLLSSWLLYQKHSRAYLDLSLNERRVIVVRYSPRNRCFMKSHVGDLGCPTKRNVISWALAVLPAQQTSDPAFTAQRWLDDTGFDDSTRGSLVHWLDQRDGTGLFSLLILCSLRGTPEEVPGDHMNQGHSDGGPINVERINW